MRNRDRKGRHFAFPFLAYIICRKVIPDFNANFQNGYNMGLVICHDGKIFLYAAEEEISETYYDLLVAKKMNQGYNDYEGRYIALMEMKEKFGIIFKEVMEYDNGE